MENQNSNSEFMIWLNPANEAGSSVVTEGANNSNLIETFYHLLITKKFTLQNLILFWNKCLLDVLCKYENAKYETVPVTYRYART